MTVEQFLQELDETLKVKDNEFLRRMEKILQGVRKHLTAAAAAAVAAKERRSFCDSVRVRRFLSRQNLIINNYYIKSNRLINLSDKFLIEQMTTIVTLKNHFLRCCMSSRTQDI